jgi:cysteine desulfurase / selenocysteine lyase
VDTVTDLARLRADFPILDRSIGRYPLVYLDSAATTQKPRAVVDAISHFYLNENANVHRAAHALSDAATAAFEAARRKLQGFVNARHAHEIIWTRGTTEAINLVAASFGPMHVKAGDAIVISEMEHHSNIVPWQQLCERTGARLQAIRIHDNGELDLEHFRTLLGNRTRIVAVGHVSNALGTINPIAEITSLAHECGATVLVDGAQGPGHLPVDVQALDVDFYAWSSHKMYGPTGIGALYGKESLLDRMPPYQTGGEMVQTVTLERTTYNRLPFKFEAGTPHIAGAIGFGVAVDYLSRIDRAAVVAYESRLLAQATSALQQIDGVRIIGTARAKAPIIGFVLEGAHSQDVGTLLDQQGIAVRTGHHCAMPLMQRLGISGTTRASFGLYNTLDDVERLTAGLIKVRDML